YGLDEADSDAGLFLLRVSSLVFDSAREPLPGSMLTVRTPHTVCMKDRDRRSMIEMLESSRSVQRVMNENFNDGWRCKNPACNVLWLDAFISNVTISQCPSCKQPVPAVKSNVY
ncbi:hypothetical protein TeGR_g3072, partial [Tetraparma gracilis]